VIGMTIVITVTTGITLHGAISTTSKV